MHSLISYILAAGAGLLVAFFLTRAPELRSLRLAQFIFLPIGFVAALSVLPDSSSGPGVGDIGSFVAFLGILGFIIILITPNIAHLCGAALSSFMDPLDWTSADEEANLRPIKRLIDKDQYHDAFDELEQLLKKYKPNSDALLLKAKLLNHFQRFDETIATLHQMIRLSKTSTQQMIAMENLASLDGHIPGEQNPIVPGARQVQIVHELLLFNPGTGDLTVNKEIPAGNYSVEEILHGRHRWLVLKGEPWGNAASCWEAVQEIGQAQSAKRGFLHRITRAQQKIVIRVKGKSFRQSKADSLAAYKEAGRLIRQGDWAGALPLLQKASADDPDSYEIAYRLVQAAHQVGPRPDAADVLNKVMAQSRWTENEEQMLRQLKR